MPVVCLISIGFNFILSEWVKLVFNQFYKSSIISLIVYWRNSLDYDPIMLYITCIFISSVILLVIYWRSSSAYDLIMMYIACLFNDEVLRTVIHCQCFTVREIDVWLLIQCWDSRQSLVIHILELGLICFFIISEDFTYNLLCNWKIKWSCFYKGVFVFSSHSILIFQ